MEDWESVLSDSGLRWIMGDAGDSSMGINKVLLAGGRGPVDDEFPGGFDFVDQCYLGFNTNNPVGQIEHFSQIPHKFINEKTGLSPNPMFVEPFDIKAQFLNTQLLINQHQFQPQKNPSFFVPLEQQTRFLMPPNPERYNHGSIESNSEMPKNPFLDSGQNPLAANDDHRTRPKRYNHGSIESNSEMPKTPFLDSGQNPMVAIDDPHTNPVRYNHGSIESNSEMTRNPFLDSGQNPVAAIDDHHNLQNQVIIDQLFKAADLIQSGNNLIPAQSILARLNHELSPIGKPFHRAAFYFKEALQLLLHSIVNNLTPQVSQNDSPFSLILKIGAYKTFSQISPFVNFVNFTCNQALLEALDGFDQIHIIDFDIGYGGQWSSLMQELSLRINGAPSLKITVFVSPLTHDPLELNLTKENLIQFANETNIEFDFEIVNIDVLASSSWSLPFLVSNNEAIAVNLPINMLPKHPLVLRFVKNLSPKIVVSIDKGVDQFDLLFSDHIIHALKLYSNLLESLDVVNMNLDALQKIERFLVQPSIEKIIISRYLFREKIQSWRTLFLSAGFSPLTFSNFAESQAECMVKRMPVCGFHVEKKQSSLVLCWRRRELVSATAWRC